MRNEEMIKYFERQIVECLEQTGCYPDYRDALEGCWSDDFECFWNEYGITNVCDEDVVEHSNDILMNFYIALDHQLTK